MIRGGQSEQFVKADGVDHLKIISYAQRKARTGRAIVGGCGLGDSGALYQSSQCLTDVCPVATSDGEDFPWLGD